MDDDKITLKELYNLAWSKPLGKISSDLGVSLSTLKKICREFDIPLPKMGYWSKVKYKKPVARGRLTDPEKAVETIIDLGKYKNEFESGYNYRLMQRIREIESLFPKESKVPEKLTRPCPLVQQAKKDLQEKRPYSRGDYEGEVETTSGYLSISVAKKNVPRMLRFVDSFIKLLEKRGHSIEIAYRGTIAVVYGERFPIKFREKCNRIQVQDKKWITTELVPNGILSVKLPSFYSTVEWMDGKKPLEQQLTSIVAALELRAEKEKDDRAVREKYWAEQKSLQEIREREARLREWEKKKVEMLIKHSSNWRISQDLSAFIAYVESQCNGKADADITPALDWIKWAKAVQRSIDPVGEDVKGYIALFEMNF